MGRRSFHYSLYLLIANFCVNKCLQEADRTKLDMEGNLKNLQKKVEDYDRDQTQLNSQIQVQYTVKFLNFGMPEIFTVIYLNFKQGGPTLKGILSKWSKWKSKQ